MSPGASRRGRFRGHLRRPTAADLPRLLAAGLVVGLLAAADRVDPVAAGVAVAALVATFTLVRVRSRRGERRAIVVLGAGATVAAIVVAMSLPVYRSRPHALVLDLSADDASSLVTARGPGAVRPAPPVVARTGPELLGFAASDYDDTGAGIDRDVNGLSSLAVTGADLGANPGTIEVRPVTDGLVRAHLAGAEALLVVSNYDGDDFNGDRVDALLGDRAARRRFVSAVSGQVVRSGWDGVVLDFENLDPSVRSDLPVLVDSLASALGGRRLLVAVPAFSDDADDEATPYDLRALSRAGVTIVWMAYDEHDQSSGPGPIASLPWVRSTLATALRSVPAGQLLLGVPTYGYVWPAGTAADDTPPPDAVDDQTVAESAALAATPGAKVTWNPMTGEWYGTLPDGRTLAYDDNRSLALRARVAAENHVGVALWRVGSDSPGSLDQIPFAPAKHRPDPSAPHRPVQDVRGPVVALTFDDGPDPKTTPKILRILGREHVPGTFFVVGREVERYPGLVRDEIANGDLVGDHTFTHPNLATLPTWRARIEILGAAWTVESVTGRKPDLFRSPYGDGDSAPGHRKTADQLAADLGMHSVNWTDDTNDWQLGKSVDQIVRDALAQASERTIILMHDGGGPRDRTIEALPRIIDGLKARGYTFATADALDASITEPYAVRHGFASAARGVAIVALFRLQLALRRLLLWLAVLTAVGSLVRLGGATPLAIVHLRRRRRMRRLPFPASTAGGPAPVFAGAATVIVPAYNEERVIAKTIAGLARLDPAPTEIIVVDDGSTDGTAAVAAAAGAHVPGFRLLRQTNGGKAAALNYGLLATTTEVAVVIDADTVVDPGLLAALLPHFADPRVGAVAGNVKVGNRRNLLAALQALEYVVALNLDRRAQDVARAMAVVPGAAGAFRVSAVREVGGYQHDTMVEDADLTTALQRAGWVIPYEPDAIVWTEAPENLTDVVRQRRRWSYGTIQVVAKHRHALLEPSSGGIGLVGLPWNLLASVVLPVLGPFADLWLVWLLLNGQWGPAVMILSLAMAADLVLAAAAVAVDGERWSLVALAPGLRLLWRPLQLAVVIRSLRRWAVGEKQAWDKVTRYDTVLVHREVDVSEALDLAGPPVAPRAGSRPS